MRVADCLPEDLAQFIQKTVALPDKLQNKNLVVEISAEGKQEFKTFYTTALKIMFNEAFGELKVTKEGKAQSRVYIKVFQLNQNGKEEFFRDGYTDIRGKFEYAQASGEQIEKIKKFAILVQSEQFGSQIKEVNPPKNESA